MFRLTSPAFCLLLGVGVSWAGCSGGGGGHDGGGSSCAATSDCGVGQYCASGSCLPQESVGACAAGDGHSASEVCASGSCLGGSCCRAACTQDPECGASACDPGNGACTYAASTKVCGLPESCTSGSYTAPSHCNGAGHCDQVAAALCPSLDCAGVQCAPACTTSSDCDGGYCGANACHPKGAAGATCFQTSSSTANESCISDLCLTHCCAAPCPSDGTACQASSCDATGACVYPDPTTACGTSSCVDSTTLNPAPACDGQGHCQPPAAPASCAPYLCDLSTGGCFASCADAGPCSPASFCQAGSCAAKEDAGADCAPTSTSSADEACQSEACLGAHCCLQSCALDPLSRCPGTCDGTGACSPQPCASGFACPPAATTCASTCTDNTFCDVQHFCDVPPSSCCPLYQPGDVIHVDGINGNDVAACCGTAGTPCLTLGRAMELVAAAKISGVVIDAVNGDATPDWIAAETWPVHLGWGVTLWAPGLFFTMPRPGIQGNSTLNHFEVYSYDAVLDTAQVTIEGGASTPGFDNAVHIGFDSTYSHGGAISAVADPAGSNTAVPLRLSSVWLDSLPKGTFGASLDVGDGAAVVLGPRDVVLGNPLGLGFEFGPVRVLAAEQGLFCHGAGATISDDPSDGAIVLQSANALDADLDVESGCVVSLTQGPTIGILNGPACDTDDFPNEGDGIRVEGGSTVAFGSAALPGAIRCCFNAGVNMDLSDATGSPTVALDHVAIQGGGCAGAYVGEGTFSAISSSFTQNFLGVWADANAIKVDLSQSDSITCNDATAIIFTGCNNVGGSPVGVGADVLNTTAALSVDAANATWDQWDGTANQTQLWSCTDNTFSACSCTGPGCPSGTGALPDDADGVFLETNTAVPPIDSTQGNVAIGSSCP